MTNAERQARFRQRQMAALERLKARAKAGDWREGKTPGEIAELDELARRYREAEKICTHGIELEREALLEFRKIASQLLGEDKALIEKLIAENKALVEKHNELVADYNELLDDYNSLLADEDDQS